MAAPAGVAQNRWSQLVRALAADAGISEVDADAWLNAVWVGMYVDEAQGFPDRREALARWLVVNAPPNSPTLPVALRGWAAA